MPTGLGTVAFTSSMSARWATRASTSVSSICASAKPMHVRSSAEWHPRAVDRSLLRSVGREEALGSEGERIDPHVGQATRDVARPEEHRALRDREVAEDEVAGRLPGAEYSGRVQPERFAHHAVRVSQRTQCRCIEIVRGTRPEHGVGFRAVASSILPACPPREQRPRQARGGGVIPGRDQRDHLIALFARRQWGIRGEEGVEHVRRAGDVRPRRATALDLLVNDPVGVAECPAAVARRVYGIGWGN